MMREAKDDPRREDALARKLGIAAATSTRWTKR